jgi:23S rRNA pseudouridine1911/1915/1917 synthase
MQNHPMKDFEADELEVLYEDNHLLVVYKPAGLLSQGDETGDVSVVDLARAYLKRKYSRPGNVYVATVHRLDRPVSGVMALARTSKAASRLTLQFRERTVRKIYRAAVEGRPAGPEGVLRHSLVKDRDRRVVSVAGHEEGPAGREAELAYRLVENRGPLSLLEVEPHTGRSHQIRVQLAEAGHPIAGDVKYGSTLRLPGRAIALQAYSLQVGHPTRAERLSFTVPAQHVWTLEHIARSARGGPHP